MKRNDFIKRELQKGLLLLILAVTFFSVSGQELPMAHPEEVGLSTERLNRIEKVMNEKIAQGVIPGGVTLVARHGKVAYFKSFGKTDVEANKDMSNDAIFRLASMSKCVTSIAVMMLYEQGYFLLSDPVSKYIPEFKNPKVVMKSPASDSIILVPAKSEITIRQLLNHTAGISYGSGLQGPYYAQAGMTSALKTQKWTIGEMVKKLATLPLLSHPGEEFHYGYSVDILGYLVEVISKMPLDEYLRQNIFEPLKMKDTYFSIPESKFPRMAGLYTQDQNGKLVKSTGYFPYPAPQNCFLGGAGLVSSTADYFRFAQMLLNKGQLDGKRLVSRKTIEMMTTNSIGDEYTYKIVGHFATMCDKFGLGFGIRTERGKYDELESLGSFGWDGAFYTKFWVDPKEDLIGIFMTNMETNDDLKAIFKVLVTQSIID